MDIISYIKGWVASRLTDPIRFYGEITTGLIIILLLLRKIVIHNYRKKKAVERKANDIVNKIIPSQQVKVVPDLISNPNKEEISNNRPDQGNFQPQTTKQEIVPTNLPSFNGKTQTIISPDKNTEINIIQSKPDPHRSEAKRIGYLPNYTLEQSNFGYPI